MTFRPGRRPGLQKKTIHVLSNDPAARDVALRVSATVEVALAVSPSAIVFPPFPAAQGSPHPRYARLTGSQSASSKIISVDCPSTFISVEVNREGFDGNAARQLRFSVLPGMPSGRFRERVVLKTDNAEADRIAVYVTGEALGAVSVTPRHLPLGIISPGTPVRRLITLRAAREQEAFRVLAVKSTVEGLGTEIIERTAGREYQVAVSVPADFQQPVVRGEIIITTDSPDQKTISVRVFGRRARAAQDGPPERSHNAENARDPM